ncbi:MAG TPA: hypothetical protein PLG52_06490, partial [Anaerolineales bacterium]|nr:hypothetical protein [Anaerolineales bacterium]
MKKIFQVISVIFLTLALLANDSRSSQAAPIFQLEADIVTGTYGPSDSNPSYMTEFNGKLYFNANADSTYDYELYVYDGVNPPSLVADIYPGKIGSYPMALAVFNNALYFGAYGSESQGTELWKYDGVNPPSLVADICVGICHSTPDHLRVFDNALYFSADGGDGAGMELWKYDGVNPPARVVDLYSG